MGWKFMFHEPLFIIQLASVLYSFCAAFFQYSGLEGYIFSDASNSLTFSNTFFILLVVSFSSYYLMLRRRSFWVLHSLQISMALLSLSYLCQQVALLKWLTFISSTLFFCTVLFGMYLFPPITKIKEPRGPHKTLGSFSLHLADPSRNNSIYGAEEECREIMCTIWFPTKSSLFTSKARPSVWLPDGKTIFENGCRQMSLPFFVAPILTSREMDVYSFREALLDPSSKYPLVIFSHGLAGTRFQNVPLCEEIASFGYVVVAIDHPGDGEYSS